MSAAQSAPTPAPHSGQPVTKPPKVLACILCQQRKVKCDRNFPCTNCVKASAQCVPANMLGPRQRRRRFPERELLDRLRHYETLLRQNNISFQPLHPHTEAAEYAPGDEVGTSSSDLLDDVHSGGQGTKQAQISGNKTTVGSRTVYATKDLPRFWDAVDGRTPDSTTSPGDEDDDNHDSPLTNEDSHETFIKKAWVQSYQNNNHLIFGFRNAEVDLSSLHPKQAHVFKLWQLYLDNVNPLLKVTHTPTLQARIVDAAGDMANIKPELEALMFSIYCVSIPSLGEGECQTLFGARRDDLLTGYQFACQQSLLNCSFLRSSDRDCLTALHLYLVSFNSNADSWSLSSLLGVAIRIAQRMGIHDEPTNLECTPFEAEMRRRLWWSLMLFDNRIGETSQNKTAMMAPTWSCRTPLNVNDFDLQPDMKSAPKSGGKPTEALFAVVRSEIGDFVRHSNFHLEFTDPSLKALVKTTEEASDLSALERKIEEQYLQFCIPDNPLHMATVWVTRGYIAKNHLLDQHSRESKSTAPRTAAQRDAVISHSLRMLECDTKLMTSPLTKGYRWLIQGNFPFPAYLNLVQELRERPVEKRARDMWEAMSDNHEARFVISEQSKNHVLMTLTLSRIIQQAWEGCEAASSQAESPLEPPRIVWGLKRKVMQMAVKAQNGFTDQPGGADGTGVGDRSDPMRMDFTDSLPYGSGAEGLAGFPMDVPQQDMVDANFSHLDWGTIDWDAMQAARSW